MTKSSLYFGTVVHRRLRPCQHRLVYKVFSLFVDLDELPCLSRQIRIFSYNRFNLFSFHDRDHGPGDGKPLRHWVESHLADAGIDLNGGSIRLLCYPRVLGYVFNPLSVYFCYGRDGVLAAIIYQVNNTFRERHSYLIPVIEGLNFRIADEGKIIRQDCEKEFYVSPFIPTKGEYRFKILVPGSRIALSIEHDDGEGPLLRAAFTGDRADFSDRLFGVAFLRYPLMTLKVIGGIHWEALRLWIKGVPVCRIDGT